MNDSPEPRISASTKKVLDQIRDTGPEELVFLVQTDLRRTEIRPTEEQVIAATIVSAVNNPTRRAMHMSLAVWDAATSAEWADGTSPATPDRRERVYELLELSDESRARLDMEFPSASQLDAMIVDPNHWTPWYTEERRTSHDFYWRAYRGVLEGKGWDVDALATLDRSTSEIVQRLTDPSASEGYQTKGLVVGHVQSGKTANFTGIVAKAIDAGYRLIIVLTGTIELLRGQTQRRLDMELIGEENILDGADPTDPASIRDIDYISTNDADWRNGKFLRHGKDIHSLPEVPSIKRLTTVDRDYRKLRLGRDALDFRRTGELVDIGKPVYAPENIFSVDARIAVMKKNSASLKNLLHDLKNIRADGREIPALIIDDEADQASVNTINPRSKSELAREVRSRTAINKLIAELLKELPRAQYVGYTATPFANVFVSPEDSEDLFPKDFLVSLAPSAQYMGGKYFHDLDGIDAVDKCDPGRSNEAAFVRDLLADGNQDPEAEDKEILAAIDAFVLSGAIKKWREANESGFEYRHHTMLVHESVQNAAQAELATKFRSVWSTAGYSSPSGLARLRALYADDFFRVSTSRREWLELPMPESFDDLRPFIGDTIDAITTDSDPVVIVNGSRESDYNAMDFQLRPYWRIMVGGAKLSRGFTVEGLTISYFRRKAGAADTMMQMGRWFGYRPGYGDLVRLYIARDVVDSRGKTYDLYDAFTSIIQDEEAFRDQLHKFSEMKEDGRPVIRPIHVPPLVFQQFPWLRPTSANKMYNAELAFEGDGGVVKDFNTHGERADGKVNASNWNAVQPLLANLSELCDFYGVLGTRFEGRYAIVSNDTMLTALRRFSLLQPDQLNPTIKMMENASAEGTLTDWAVIVPELDDSYGQVLDGHKVSVMERQRRLGRPGFAGSERRHRATLEEISQLKDRFTPAGPTAEMLSTPTRGAFLLTFTFDPALQDDERAEGRVAKTRLLRANRPSTLVAEDLATLFSLAMPYGSAPRGRLGFRVRRGGAEAESPIVDRD